jgi:hypothetical protein
MVVILDSYLEGASNVFKIADYIRLESRKPLDIILIIIESTLATKSSRNVLKIDW